MTKNEAFEKWIKKFTSETDGLLNYLQAYSDCKAAWNACEAHHGQEITVLERALKGEIVDTSHTIFTDEELDDLVLGRKLEARDELAKETSDAN